MPDAHEPGKLGGIEAGGTKFVCVLAEHPGAVVERRVIPTTSPEETLEAAIRFFRDGGPLRALGVASFGPVELDRAAPAYGSITRTPKSGWAGVALVERLERALQTPVGFDTDVNGAALGEGRGGAGEGLSDYVYVTVGTGIGAGIVSSGRLLHGASHPEVGHIRVPRHPDDEFAGHCPFHGDCLEGLASAPALAARWQCDPADLPDDHPAWVMQAHYLACLCHNLTSFAAPRRILLGGGVMARAGLLDRVREHFVDLAGGYFPWVSSESAGRFIQAPGHGGRSGEIGALILAERALNDCPDGR